MDINLFLDILKIDSTSGLEANLANKLEQWFVQSGADIRRVPSPKNEGEPYNLLLTWGKPEIVFCTHLDTVPPYIAPTVIEDEGHQKIMGRGACDAKGQIFSMYTACCRLAQKGAKDFALLLLHGEETGSFGAKAFRELPGGKFVIVGEPTDNKMVKASKGTKAFEVTIYGKAFHSGYPEYGISAVSLFVDLINRLNDIEFPLDPLLGETTFNVGKLISDNPQNILSPKLTCRIYFRTTFSSDSIVCETMKKLSSERIEIKPLGGDTPMHYFTVPGFSTTTVSFGSDAPQLTNFQHKMLCGPGSILVAHTDNEFILVEDLEKAVNQYVAIYDSLKKIIPLS